MADTTPPATPDPQSTPFVFDDPRQRQIHDRLTRLVGPGAADFYRDACRLMAGSVRPPLATTTHIVAHCLREVESALRGVLAPIALKQVPQTVPAATKGKGNGTHLREIQVVLAMLGISPNEALAKAWLALPDSNWALHGLAHRRGLRSSRPIDRDFHDLWAELETILHGVLDRFEAQYLMVSGALDVLAQKTDPTPSDAKYFVSAVPNNFVSHTRFFEGLTNPKWLPLLRDEHVFKEPPTAEYETQDGATTVRCPLWPAATYLQKMALVEPTTVRDILLEVGEADNARVQGELLEITASLPKAQRLSLVDRVKVWVNAQEAVFTSGPAGEVVTKFLEDGEVEVAKDVSRVLLGLYAMSSIPYVTPDGRTYTPSPEVRSRLDAWQYGQFMERVFAKIARACPEAALDLACGLLNEFLNLEYPDHLDGDRAYCDYTRISRPAIEDHPQNRLDDELENHVIRAARDAASEVVKLDPNTLGDVVAYLREKRWSVFLRIALHTVTESADPQPIVVKDLLLDETLFVNSDTWHEYARLLGRHFGILDADSKKVLYDWIGSGAKVAGQTKDTTEEEAKKRKEGWELELLAIIGNQLESPWKERRDELAAKYGEPEHPDFLAHSEEGVHWEASVKAAEDLLNMTPDDVITLLATWEPPELRHHPFEHTRDGLARELSAAIKVNPTFFAGKEEAFQGLDATYVRAFIQASEELIQNGHGPNWDAVLRLCTWVIEQPRTIAGRVGRPRDQDESWSGARSAINRLVATGLRRDLAPYERRERIWKIIAALADDPDPTNDEGEGAGREEAYTRAINSVRGYALEVAVEYGLWVRRQEKGAGGPEVGLEAMPELRQALEKHLADSSVAVHAVYGRYLPWLILMGKEWTETHLDNILPPEPLHRRIWEGVWNTYLLYTRVYSNVFPSLRKQYTAAIDDLGRTPAVGNRFRDPQRKLVEHLFAMYWRGVIPLSDPLLLAFWRNANAELRGYAMDFVGHALRTLKEPLQPDEGERLRALWNERYNLAMAANDKTEFESEMAGFGSWFASDQFDDDWVSDQYLLALDFGSRTTAYHFVTKRLHKLVESRSLDALRILRKLCDLKEPNWFVMGSRKDIADILRAALQSSDGSLQVMAREIGNRLVARGNSTYETLLREFPG